MDEHEFINRMSTSFQNELQKIASSQKTSSLKKMLLPAAAGVVAWEGIKRVEKDRKLGRTLRRQQPGRF
jgi:hypothetical protein